MKYLSRATVYELKNRKIYKTGVENSSGTDVANKTAETVLDSSQEKIAATNAAAVDEAKNTAKETVKIAGKDVDFDDPKNADTIRFCSLVGLNKEFFDSLNVVLNFLNSEPSSESYGESNEEINDDIGGVSEYSENNCSNCFVKKAFEWLNLGKAGIKGAKHCTDWVAKVYGIKDVSHLTKVKFRGATNKHGDFVKKINAGTGYGASRGASLDDINNLPVGTHVMIDHCRNGHCNRGATHSAMIVGPVNNGKALVISYPNGNKPPRKEYYTFSEDGHGDTKRVIRAHYAPTATA